MKNYLRIVCGSMFMLLATSMYSMEVVFNVEFPEPKGPLTIYEKEKPLEDYSQVWKKFTPVFELTKAEKLLEKPKLKRADDRYSYSDDQYQVSFSEEGTDFYLSDFAKLKLTEKTGELPSDEKAIDLSLGILKETGLMPRDREELKVDHVGGIMQMLAQSKDTELKPVGMKVLPKEEKLELKPVEPAMRMEKPQRTVDMAKLKHIGEPEKKAVVVYFYREIDGLRVMNYGSSITMTLTEDGTPAGLQYHWSEIGKAEKKSPDSLVPEKRVYDSIKEDLGKVFDDESVIVIESIDLVLYDNGGDYIQPAYCYRGFRKSRDEKIPPMPVLGYVPALTDVVEPIHHPALMGVSEKPGQSMEKEDIQSTESDD